MNVWYYSMGNLEEVERSLMRDESIYLEECKKFLGTYIRAVMDQTESP